MSGYCKYCDTLKDDIVQAFNDNHQMVWTGCLSCYEKRNELNYNAKNKRF